MSGAWCVVRGGVGCGVFLGGLFGEWRSMGIVHVNEKRISEYQVIEREDTGISPVLYYPESDIQFTVFVSPMLTYFVSALMYQWLIINPRLLSTVQWV